MLGIHTTDHAVNGYLIALNLRIAAYRQLTTTTNSDGLARIVVQVSYPFKTLIAWPGMPSEVQLRKRVEVLAEQIQNLRRTRDLLLPRLLAGQVPLSTKETHVNT